MRLAALPLLMIVASTAPALAEPRWLACRFNDAQGKPQNFYLMFDEARNIASIFEADSGAMVEGANTSINFQFIRTRFPAYNLTYNRNDGALGMSPIGGGAFIAGLLQGECRRTAAPPGAPRI